MNSRRAFTIIEILVVIAVIAVLIGLAVVAVQQARDAGARSHCQNNLRQIGIALHSYEGVHKAFPMGARYPAGPSDEPWSAPARLLDFIEKETLRRKIDWSKPPETQPDLVGTRVATFLCSSEVNDRQAVEGELRVYPTSYGLNYGTWQILNPVANKGSDGAFSPNRAFRPTDFSDGLSTTLGASEVKAFTPYLRDSGHPAALDAPAPLTVEEVVAFGGQLAHSGHTEWTDGKVHQTGFTTTFSPNTLVAYSSGGVAYDVDFNSSREGLRQDRATYAAVTSRSYHSAGVNALLMDGSVRLFSRPSQTHWRALGTRAGSEPAGEE